MKTLAVVGIFLIIVGAAVLVFRAFSYTTTRTTAKIGPIGITTQEKHTVSVPPVVGVVLVAAGIFLLIAGNTRQRSS